MAEVNLEEVLDKMTFREKLEMRKLVAGVVTPDEMDDPPIAAVIPAAVCVLQRRSDETFDFDKALDLTEDDLAKLLRPTRRKTAAKS
jgi:hypothetical protein